MTRLRMTRLAPNSSMVANPRRADANRCARRDAACRAHEQRVAPGQATLDLDPLRFLVAEPELDLHPLHLAVLETNHERLDARHIDRARRRDKRIAPLARH